MTTMLLQLIELKKRIRKFTFLKYSIFGKRTFTVNLKNFSSNINFRWYTFGKFYIVKFNYFSGEPNKGKERFWNIFDWHYASDIGNKSTAETYIKNLASMSPTQYQACYIYNSLIHRCIIYLDVTETYLNITIAIF